MIIVQQIINGVIIGSIYALVTLGFTTVYGVANILNVAQADIATLTGYVSLFVFTNLGLGAAGAVVGGIIASLGIGIVLFYAVFSRIRSGDLLAMFIATIGLSFLIEYGLAAIAGSAPRLYPALLPAGSVHLGSLVVANSGLTVVGICLALALVLWLLIEGTAFGRRVRAVAAMPEMASAVGINVGRVRLLMVMISSLLGGIAGLLLSALYTNVQPFVGQTLAFNMFVIAVVGGVGSIPGTVVVGLIVGIIPAVTSAYLNVNVTAMLPLALLVIVLRIRPEGLFGSSNRRMA